MSCFAELPPQLFLLGNALRTGLILGGTSYLQDLLLPMNVSDRRLAPVLDKLDSVKRQGWLVNDAYALQNLMESFLDFQPLTAAASANHVPERRRPRAVSRCRKRRARTTPRRVAQAMARDAGEYRHYFAQRE